MTARPASIRLFSPLAWDVWPLLALLVIAALPICAHAGVLEEWQKGVVRIIVQKQGEFGSGSGFVIDRDNGYIVTNAHVIADEIRQMPSGDFIIPDLPPDQIVVQTYDNSVYPVREVVWRSNISLKFAGFSEENGPRFELDCGKDLAILKVGPVAVPALAIAESGAVRAGDRVRVLGYPVVLERVLGGEQPLCEVSEGVIGAARISPNDTRVFTTDAAVNRGNSGGPLINEWGNVVGVVSEMTSDFFALDNQAVPVGSSLGMATQSDELIDRLRQLGIAFHHVEARQDLGRWTPSLWLPTAASTLGMVVALLALLYRRLKKHAAPGQQGVLRGLSGEYRGACLPIASGIRIGRDPGLCNLVMDKNNARISKCHAEVRYNPDTGAFVLCDIQSRGGTFLDNGQPVPYGKPAVLRNGDGFYLVDRDCAFRVELQGTGK